MFHQRPITTDRLMFSLTGLSLNEFDRLLERFEPIYHEFRAKELKKRIRNYNKGKACNLTIKQLNKNGKEIDLAIINIKIPKAEDLQKMEIGTPKVGSTVAMLGNNSHTDVKKNSATKRNEENNRFTVFSKIVPNSQLQTDGYDTSLNFSSPNVSVDSDGRSKITTAEEIINSGASGGGVLSYEDRKLVIVANVGREGNGEKEPDGQAISLKGLNIN